MSPENIPKLKNCDDNNSENHIHNVLLMTEVGIDLKEKYISGEKCICYLKSIVNGADKAIGALQHISKTCLDEAKKALDSVDETDLRSSIRPQYAKLKAVLEAQLTEFEPKNLDAGIENLGLTQISEKIKNLEYRQKNLENSIYPAHTYSNKNIKADIDEKYPENLSRESLIDLNTIVNLPPVPEDIFTSFSNKPTRSSSLSSLKSMRKIKLHLQKAESSDDDDSSDNDDHEYSKVVYGDSDDSKTSSLHSPLAKKLLGNIKEETQD